MLTIEQARAENEQKMWRIFHETLEEFERPEVYCMECGEKITDIRGGKRDYENHYHCTLCCENNLEIAKRYLDPEFYENLKATVDSWIDWED